ncbi:hypothetical protein GCM10009603_44640 [Nocardiopsis exhalans]
MVVLAVELAQLGLEVPTHLPHDLLAPGEHGASQSATPILRDEDQMDMKVIYDLPSGAYIGVQFPSW